jgi:hypothetical protein
MHMSALEIGAVILVVLVIVYALYRVGVHYGLLCPHSRKSGFVGAYGRAPGMQYCLAYDTKLGRMSDFNRCMWV